MRLKRFVVTGAVLLAGFGPAGSVEAQQGAGGEEAAVRAVIDRLFDGMRSRDTTAMAATFAPGAQLYNTGRDGRISAEPASAFTRSVAGAPAGMVLDEVLHNVEVRIDGPLASAWMYYDFFAGENFSHCGYNAFQLLKGSEGWRIVAISDSRRRDGCRQQRRGGGQP